MERRVNASDNGVLPKLEQAHGADQMPPVGELRRDFLLARSHAPIFHIEGKREDCPRDLACVIAIGAFDGCHRGHLDLLRHAIDDARERGIAAVAVTFSPDPDEVLSPNPALKLTTPGDRLSALASTGMGVAVVPFTRELAALDHEAFFTRVLTPTLDIKAIHVGSDFRLGKNGASTVDVIRAWGARRGIAVHGHTLLLDGESPITATRIRSLLAAGELDHAAHELGRRYLVRGTVTRGRGQGTGMGFPTANIELASRIQLPADGVYAGLALVNGEVWPAAINAGLPPMFHEDRASAHLEANLLGYHGDLYGADIALVFTHRLRPSVKFASVDELIQTVNNDIQTVRELLGDEPVRIA